MRFFAGAFALLFLALGVRAAESLPPLPITVAEWSVPASATASSPTLARGNDGVIRLSWVERGADDSATLRFSVLDETNHRWSHPVTVASGSGWTYGNADRPSLLADSAGHLTAWWLANQPSSATPNSRDAVAVAQVARSADAGATWSSPMALSHESPGMEFPTAISLPDNRTIAAWLDGRGRHHGAGAQQLVTRIVRAEGPDQVVDASVCDCCLPTLATFPDGSALLAYRGRTPDEIRDIRVACFRDGQWSEGHNLHADGWKIAGCPVNGPKLASAGGRAGIAWFTAAHSDAQVLASFSPDAGARWLSPVRIDRGHPLGHVDLAMLADGSMFVLWVESGGDQPGLWLRRISPEFQAGQAARLVAGEQLQGGDYPRLALVKDYDATPAKLIVSYMERKDASALHTLLVTLPDRSTLAGRKPCLPCDEAEVAAARGYPMRGRIVSVGKDHTSMLVAIEEIPGVMRAQTLDLHADANTLSAAIPGRELLGRIERQEKQWRVFNVRWLGP